MVAHIMIDRIHSNLLELDLCGVSFVRQIDNFIL
jgi:hypothetical protein